MTAANNRQPTTTTATMSSTTSPLLIVRGPCHEEEISSWRRRSDSDEGECTNNNIGSTPCTSYEYCRRVPHHYDGIPNDSNKINRSKLGRRRRRRPPIMNSVAMTLAAIGAMIATSSSPITLFSVESFATPHYGVHTSSPTLSIRRQITILNSVHKRSGNHDLSHTTTRAASSAANDTIVAASRTKKKIVTSTKHQQQRKKTSSTKLSSTATSTAMAIQTTMMMDSPSTVDTSTFARSRGGRMTNVFEQFTPEYMQLSPLDVMSTSSSPSLKDDLRNGATINNNNRAKRKISSPSPLRKKNGANNSTTNNKKGVNKSLIQKSNRINLRLRTLLTDDTGEQDLEQYPDSSPEAASQLAELKSYNKLSEEARRKANIAVKSGVDDDDDDEINSDDVESSSTSSGRRTKGTLKNRVVGSRSISSSSSSSAKPRGEYIGTKEEVVSRTSNKNNNMVTLQCSSTGPLKKKQRVARGRVRATVKETGSDSIGSYIKSLGQHELLYKEDEVLLGRQVRLLSVLEERRYELEEELLR